MRKKIKVQEGKKFPRAKLARVYANGSLVESQGGEKGSTGGGRVETKKRWGDGKHGVSTSRRVLSIGVRFPRTSTPIFVRVTSPNRRSPFVVSARFYSTARDIRHLIFYGVSNLILLALTSVPQEGHVLTFWPRIENPREHGERWPRKRRKSRSERDPVGEKEFFRFRKHARASWISI